MKKYENGTKNEYININTQYIGIVKKLGVQSTNMGDIMNTKWETFIFGGKGYGSG